ncbi:MAG: hypothetical protein WAN35_19730 [Terracidiphilus sp.]
MFAISRFFHLRVPLVAGFIAVTSLAASQSLPTGGARAVVVDPNNPFIVYAAGGVSVYRSTNKGQTWTNLELPSYSSDVTGLALDPSNSNILYAATNSGVFFINTNGGQGWVHSRTDPGCANSIATVATTPTTIYVGTCGWGVYKSTDGGYTWAPTGSGVATQSVISLAVYPVYPGSILQSSTQETIYAGTANGVYKSTDSGQTWGLSSFGLSNSEYNYVWALAVDPSQSGYVWAGTDSGLFLSKNGGQSWSPVGTGLPTVMTIAFDPFTHSTMYVGAYGFGGFYKSTNGGQSWTPSYSGLPTSFSALVSSIAADPSNPCVLYAATFTDSIYSSVNCGINWFADNAGIQMLEIYGIAVNPKNGLDLYVGTHTTGVYRSVDGGLNWSNSGFIGSGSNGTIWSLAIDSTTPNILVATDEIGIYRTTDSGLNWKQSSDVGSIPLAIDPENSSVMYSGSYQSVLKSINSGESWTSYTTGLPSTPPWAIAVDPADSFSVYAGTLGSGVYHSTDGGQQWSACTALTYPYVEALSFDRNTPAALYAGSTVGLFMSPDGCQSWFPVTGGLPAYFFTDVLAFDPSNTNIFYAAGFQGIYKTVSGGQTWVAANSGLQSLYVESLAIDPSHPTTIYAGLNGGGLYKSTNGGALWTPLGSAGVPATLTSPLQGATLAGSSQTFNWDPVVGATGYTLYLGSTGMGSANLNNSKAITSTTTTVNSLPVNGATIYARLWTNFNGVYKFTDSTFTAASPATLTAPTQGATLDGASETFTWAAIPGVTGYSLFLGSTGAGSANLLDAHTTATNLTANNLPLNGETIYARLWTNVKGVYTYTDSTLIAALPAALTAPAQGSIFTSNSQTFTWTFIPGVTGYALYLGSTGAGSGNLYDSKAITATTVTVNNLPINGKPIYARLWTNVSGVYTYNDYTFTAK